jgi:single-stranded-DNA-specific exonuclease
MVTKTPPAKKKIWKFPETAPPPAELIAAAGGDEILARLMMRRGILSAGQAESFLDPGKYRPSSPMQFADMARALVRISQAIASREKITVYGDYDADGVTGTSLLLTVLKKLGANVDFYIPNRASEGYGLNLKAVSILAAKHRCKLIISCDCGISNFAEINLARSLGVETIVADHHAMPEVLPPAVAILHPKLLAEDHPLYHLPGVGVAYKLAEALLEDNKLSHEVPALLDFVALGMIADLVPLVAENRYLVQTGLPVLMNSPRPGIRAMLENTLKMDGTDIVGFGLAPRINAVGRLADASLAVRLMTVEADDEARQLAGQLEMENARRQELCEQIFFEADLKAQQALAAGQDGALAIYSPDWHHGVVGIVASRLVEKYHCPVFIAEIDEAAGLLKGSARGVNGINLYEILRENEHLLTRWGGHQMAAGFSAEALNAETLCRALVNSCNRALAGQSRRPVLEIDLVADAQIVDLNLAKLLQKLGPFGMWNKKPVLAMQSLAVVSSRPLGKEGKHHRLMLRSTTGGSQFECVYWRSSGNLPDSGQLIDLACNCEVNVYNKTQRLQLVLCDWRATGETESVAEEDILDFRPDLQAAAKAAPEPAALSQAAAPRVQPSSPQEDWSPSDGSTGKAQAITFKDLRDHDAPESVIETACARLKDRLNLFAESCQMPGYEFADRSCLPKRSHLLIWQFPPSLQVFRLLLAETQASQIYICGGAAAENYDATTFLKRLLSMVRFAVNQRDGEAHADKLCAALSTTKMALALGLTLLKKLDVIDWYSEDSVIFLEITGSPAEGFEKHPEYRQLANTLQEITEFRNWCAKAPLDEIQSQLVPNAIRLSPENAAASQEDVKKDTTLRAIHNDRASHVESGKPRKS